MFFSKTIFHSVANFDVVGAVVYFVYLASETAKQIQNIDIEYPYRKYIIQIILYDIIL